MIEPTGLKLLNKRMAELLHSCELRKNRPSNAILDELFELNIVRDELQKIQHAADRHPQISVYLSKEFPTIDSLLLHLHSVARQIATTPKDDPRRAELLNEITRVSLAADCLFKREL
jgi:hypothetical protein